MPMKLSNYYRERTIALWKEGANVSAIVRALHEEGRNTTRGTVRRWIFRLEQDRSLQDDFREGRPLKITSEISEYLVRRLEEYDERTSFELQRLVARKFGTDISAASIRRYLRVSLQWAVVRTRYGPMISDTNKQKRLEFAKICWENHDDLDNVIWTDESSVQLKSHCQTMRVKIGRETNFKPVAKHALNVHVWAGISRREQRISAFLTNNGCSNICADLEELPGIIY